MTDSYYPPADASVDENSAASMGSGEGGENSGPLGWGYSKTGSDGEKSWVGLSGEVSDDSQTKTVKSVAQLNDILGDLKFEAVGNLAEQGITNINANAAWNLYFNYTGDPNDLTAADSQIFSDLSITSSVNGYWSKSSGDTFVTNEETGESTAQISLKSNKFLQNLQGFVDTTSTPARGLFDDQGKFALSDRGEICLSLAPTEFFINNSTHYDPEKGFPAINYQTKIVNNPNHFPVDSLGIHQSRELTPDIKLSLDSAFWEELGELRLQADSDGASNTQQTVDIENVSANWGNETLESTGISTDASGTRVIDLTAIQDGADTLTDFYKGLESALAFDLNVDSFKRLGNAGMTASFESEDGDLSINLEIGDHETSWTRNLKHDSAAATFSSQNGKAVNATLTGDNWTGTSFELELNSRGTIEEFLRHVGEAHYEDSGETSTEEILWTLENISFNRAELYPQIDPYLDSGEKSIASQLDFKFKTKFDSNAFSVDETFNQNQTIDPANGFIDTSALKGLNLDLQNSQDFVDKIKLNLDQGYSKSKFAALSNNIDSEITFDVYDEGQKLEAVSFRLNYDSVKGAYEIDSDLRMIKDKIYNTNSDIDFDDIKSRNVTLRLREEESIRINIDPRSADSQHSEVRLSRPKDGSDGLTDIRTEEYRWMEENRTYPEWDEKGYRTNDGWGYASDWSYIDFGTVTYEERVETYESQSSTNAFLDYSNLTGGNSWAPEIYSNIGEIKLENLWTSPEQLQISSLQAKSSAFAGLSDGEQSFEPSLDGKAVQFNYNLFDKNPNVDPQTYIDPLQSLKQIGVLGDNALFQNDIYGKEYTLQITAKALGGYDLEGVDVSIDYDSRIFENIEASDITIGSELPIANAVQITEGTYDSDNNWTDGTIRIAASSLSHLADAGDGITASTAAGVLATINLNFDEQGILDLGFQNINDKGIKHLVANPLEFKITANSDETILSKTVDEDGSGFVNKNIQSLRDLGDEAGSKVAASGDDVTLYKASVDLDQTSGIVMGTERTIGSFENSEAAFTNLVRAGDTIKTTNKWKNVGNMVANQITISAITDAEGEQTNAHAQLVEGSDNSYFVSDAYTPDSQSSPPKDVLLGGSWAAGDGTYDDTMAQSGTVHASIKITGIAGQVVDLSDGIYQIQAQGGAAESNAGHGSKNLITFAGDVNYDGRVSMKDIAYLNAGAARQADGTTNVDDANGGTATVVAAEARALDVDTNFDGTISMADLAAIDADWGESLHEGVNTFTGSSNQFSWAQLDEQLYDHDGDPNTAGVAGGVWDNTAFKEANAIEFGAETDYVAPLEVGETVGSAVGGNGPNALQDPSEPNPSTTTENDITGDYFQ